MPSEKYASGNEPPKQSSQIAIHILLHSQGSPNAAHLISSDTIHYKAPPLGITSTWDLIEWITLCMFTILQIRKRTKKKPTAKTYQHGLQTGHQMTKGPDLHHAQQSLTHLIQSWTKVNTDMQRAKKDTPAPQYCGSSKDPRQLIWAF